MHKNMSFLLIYCWAVFFSITLTCNYYSTCKSKLQQLHNCTHSYHSFLWKMQTQVYIFFSATSTGANNCHTESLIIVLVCLSCMSFDITCTCLYVCVCVCNFPFSIFCLLFIYMYISSIWRNKSWNQTYFTWCPWWWWWWWWWWRCFKTCNCT